LEVKRLSNGKKNGKKTINNWIIKVSIITFVLALLFSLAASLTLTGVKLWFAWIVLLIIIVIGVVFDMIGIAVTAADETPLHSMAAKKVKAASLGVAMIRNADIVSNFCNDVVGDICGILSGTAAAVIVFRLLAVGIPFPSNYLNIIITAIIATLTVGGKALGKSIAISRSKEIVYYSAIFLYKLESKLGISFFNNNSYRKR
jgi:CBS domain containing-hemolysin-like protein